MERSDSFMGIDNDGNFDLDGDGDADIREEEEDADEEKEYVRRESGSLHASLSSTSSSAASLVPHNNHHKEAADSFLLDESPQWPQSYRRSIDAYSLSASPNFGQISPTLFTLTRKLTSSFRKSSLSQDGFYGVVPDQLKTLLVPDEEECHKSDHDFPFSHREEKIRKLHEIESEKVKLEISLTPGCTFTQAVFNGVNVMAGVGLLSTPYAVKEGGWLSLVALFGFAVICCYTGILLRRCLESGSCLLTYPDIGQAAFGKLGRFLISIILYTELYAYCVEFIILEGDNLSQLFPSMALSNLWPQLSSQNIFMILAAVIVLPTVWVRNLSLLSYLSAGGVMTTMLVLMTVFWVGAFDGVGFHETGPLIKWSTLPLSLGMYGFCYSGHAVFPNIYSSMRNRGEFNRVLQVSFLICTFLYGSMAIGGYLMFGESMLSQITLNLPKTFLASKIALWTTVLNPLSKFALIINPVAMSLEELLPLENKVLYNIVSSLWRTSIVVSIVFVALFAPFFGYMMALIGSVLSMFAAVIFPCICFLSIFHRKASTFEVSLCVSIIVIGAICCIVGTYSSLSGMTQSV